MSPQEDLSDPPEVSELVKHLVDLGMQVGRDIRGGMGGAEILLHEGGPEKNPSAEVRILGERRHWTVGLKFYGMAEFRTPDEWKALIFGGPVELSSLRDQTRFIQDNLELARKTCVARPDAERAMAAAGIAAVKREYPSLAQLIERDSSID